MMNYFPLERNRYFYGKLLTVQDFEAEQNYFGNKRRLGNRVMRGAGVACGLGVSTGEDFTLTVESGFALDYLGREIVVEEPLYRKLQMLDGQENLKDKNEAWLCLAYDEKDTELVNAVGGATDGLHQYNMTREGYRLYLSTDTPDYHALFEASGRENTNVLYRDEELTLVLSVPSGIRSGEEFRVSVLVIKNEQTPPVQFNLEGVNTFVESPGGRVLLEYHESPDEKRKVYFTDFVLRAQSLTDYTNQLFPEGAELNIELGSHHYKNYINIDAAMSLCTGTAELEEHYRKTDNLEKHLCGESLPIYLAKLELIHSAGSVFIGSVTSQPFRQTLQYSDRGSSSGGSLGDFTVSSAVRSLEYWQKPDIKAVWNAESGSLNFDFGIPSPEQYDYMVSHGCVEIPMPGGIRVNAKYYSDEIPHGLGAGAVDVRLSVEFEGREEQQALITGTSEVFRGKKNKFEKAAPWVDTAAVIYPEKGTIQIGVWLHDDVPGNVIRVHYFASKPGLDASKMVAERKTSISILPEMARLLRGEQLRLKALVVGSDDKAVSWSVKEDIGGSIDKNGIYQAPELQGTYEIIATSSADPNVKASAFVIVD